MSKETVLVLQTGLRPGRWACRSLRRGGFRVIAAHDVGRLAGRTRHAHAFRRYPPAAGDGFLEAVAEIVERDRVDVLLPLDEGIVKRLAEEWTGPGAVAGPTAPQYHALCDKEALAAVAASVGIATPRGLVAPVDPAELPPLPSVVKRRVSGAPLPHLGTTIAHTEAERTAAIRAFVAATGEAFVQELVKGSGLRVLCAFDGRTLRGVTVLTRHRFPRGTGMSSVSETVHAPHLLELTERLLSAVGYRGPGELEFIERDGAFLLHDVNLRLPAAVGVAATAGFDMPCLAVEAALARPIDSAPTHGARYVWLGGELQALLARRRSEPAAPIVREIVLAAMLPRRTLDSLDLTDPLPTVSAMAALAHAVRAARRPQ